MSERSPGMAEVIRMAIRARDKALRVSLPGRIESFDPVTQTADVKPLLTETRDAIDGTTSEVALDVLVKVPVQFAGSGGFLSTMPVVKGDPCWLFFADRSIDNWFGTGEVADPNDVRRHNISDAVAILGVRSEPGALSEFDQSRAVLGKLNGLRIAFDNFVHLGVTHEQAATHPLIKGDTRNTDEASMLGQLIASYGKLVTEFGALAGGLTAAMIPNAIPIVGGALALPGFTIMVTQLGLIASELGAIGVALSQFSTKLSTHLSLKVKTE